MTITPEPATTPSASAGDLPGYWYAELLPLELYRYGIYGAHIDYPERGSAAWPAPMPLMWEPDGIAPHTEPIQVGTVEAFATRTGAAHTTPIPVLWGAGRLDLSAPGFAELLTAAQRCAPYGTNEIRAGQHRGFLLGVRADLDDLTRTTDDQNRRAVSDWRLSWVSITCEPEYSQATYLRLCHEPYDLNTAPRDEGEAQ